MKTKERKHHPYSPSTLANLEVCPCYLGKQDAPHIRAIMGTKAHKAAETGMDDHELSDEDAAAAAECMDFAEQRRRLMQAQADAHYRAAQADATKPLDSKKYRIKEFKESYLPVDDIEFADGVKHTTAGYVDLCIMSYDQTYAELIDYKFGLWPVEDARYNLQGLAYVLGLFKKYKSLKAVRLFFKQPLIGSISDWEVKREDIPAIYLRIQTVVARAREARINKDFSTANPTVPVCNFCANIGICPKVTGLACRVGNKFYPVEIPENITPTMVLSTKDTVIGLRLAQVVSIWADSFKKQLNDRVLRGDAEVPPGYALTTKQDREIVDLNAFQAVAENYIRPGEFLQCCTPSFGKVEKIISDRAERGQKSAEIKKFGDELLARKAVVLGQPYAFLRVLPSKKDDSQSNT